MEGDGESCVQTSYNTNRGEVLVKRLYEFNMSEHRERERRGQMRRDCAKHLKASGKSVSLTPEM